MNINEGFINQTQNAIANNNYYLSNNNQNDIKTNAQKGQ